MNLGTFKDLLSSFADDLYNDLRERRRARVIAHLDADGLSAAGIIISMLERLNVNFHLSIAKYMSESLIKKLREEPYDLYIFVDIGSGDLDLMRRLYEANKRVFIIDHHVPSYEDSKVKQLNPFLSGLDGDREISGSGTAFMLYYEMIGDHSMAPVAITGALGDLQEDNGFYGLNKEILELAKSKGLIEVKPDLKLFGGPDYPLVSSLERTVDPVLEGISGNSAGALSLVENIGIPIKVGERWTTLSDLTDEQKRDLLNELVKRAGGLERAKSLVGNVYVYLKEPKGSPLRDLNSFATILNACGRTGNGHIGALLASGRRGEVLLRAMSLLQEYRKILAQALDRASHNIRKVGTVAFIDEGLTSDTMIGTITSILSRSLRDTDILVGYAPTDDGMIKVSARLTEEGKKRSLNLDKILRLASEIVGGSGGGHQTAAGAQIPKEGKNKFENALLSYLE